MYLSPRELQLNVGVRAAGDVNDRPAEGLVQRAHRCAPAPDAPSRAQRPANKKTHPHAHKHARAGEHIGANKKGPDSLRTMRHERG